MKCSHSMILLGCVYWLHHAQYQALYYVISFLHEPILHLFSIIKSKMADAVAGMACYVLNS